MNGAKEPEPPSPVELALAWLVVTIEGSDPGFCNRWVENAESDAVAAEVRRLHAQAPNPVLVANMQAAMTLARNVRFVALAACGESRNERKRRKGRG